MTPETLAGNAERLHREINRFELVSRWADDLAHEIKNPFHAMIINLELVKRRAGDPEGLRDRAEVVESELNRVHGLIDSLLRLVRPWSDAGSVDADAVFETLLPVLRARADLHQIEYRHEPGAGTVVIPPADLVQVIANLTDNAVDALAEGGHVVTRCARGDAMVRIEVADDGPGVPALDADVFAPGVTDKDGRSGLGLTVARRLAEQAGGSLAFVAGSEAPGTTIALDLRAGAA